MVRVGDGLISEILAASFMVFPLWMKFFLQFLITDLRHKSLDGTAKTGRLIDDCRAGIKPSVAGHKKDGLDLPIQFPVDQGELKFVFEIGKGAETPDNHVCPLPFNIFHQESVVSVDADILTALDHSLDHLQSFCYGKDRFLVRIEGDENDQFIN